MSRALPLGRPKRAIGLDVGTSLIKAVEARKVRGVVEVIRIGVHPTPEGAVRDGNVLDPPRVAEAVREALRAGGIRGREAYAAIAGDDVVVRHAVFPRMPKEELAQAVKWDAGSHIPYPVKEASIDFEVTGSPPDSPDKIEVMIVAAPKRIVASHIEAMQLAGVWPVVLDIQPVTLCRVFRGDRSTSGFYVDIGGGTTDLAYSELGVLRFTRMVGLGGNTFTEAMALAAKKDFSWAEAAKRRACVPKALAPKSMAEEPPEDELLPDGSARRALLGVAARLALEVRRSVDYCSAQARARSGKEASIDEMVLTGGGARLQGLAEHLEKSTGISSKLGDPLMNVSLASEHRVAEAYDVYGPSLTVAVGLALRGVDGP